MHAYGKLSSSRYQLWHKQLFFPSPPHPPDSFLRGNYHTMLSSSGYFHNTKYNVISWFINFRKSLNFNIRFCWAILLISDWYLFSVFLKTYCNKTLFHIPLVRNCPLYKIKILTNFLPFCLPSFVNYTFIFTL